MKEFIQIVILAMLMAGAASIELLAQKSSDDLQFAPPQFQVKSEKLVGSQLTDLSTISLFPSDDPMQTPCSKLCAEYVELRVTLSNSGSDKRLLKTTSAYDFTVDFKVESISGGLATNSYPGGLTTKQLQIDEVGDNSKSTFVIDYTQYWRNNCTTNQSPEDEIRIIVETVDDINTSTAIRDSIRLEAEVFIRYKVHPYMDIAKFHYSTTPGPGLLPLATKVATG